VHVTVKLHGILRDYRPPGFKGDVLNLDLDDGATVLHVSQRIGIPRKDLDRIFERFYQVEPHIARKHGGLGLGLAISKTMVELHGGRIWCESVEGKGSRFTFALPVDATPKRVTRSTTPLRLR